MQLDSYQADNSLQNLLQADESHENIKARCTPVAPGSWPGCPGDGARHRQWQTHHSLPLPLPGRYFCRPRCQPTLPTKGWARQGPIRPQQGFRTLHSRELTADSKCFAPRRRSPVHSHPINTAIILPTQDWCGSPRKQNLA